MGNMKKVQNHEYHVSEEGMEEMDVENQNGVRNSEIDYIRTNRSDIVKDVTIINIGSGHILVTSNIKLNVEVERKTLMTKRPPRVDITQIGSKKIEL